MKVLGAGERVHRVTHMQRSVTVTDLESVPTYAAKSTYWAKVEPLSSRELLLAGTSQVYSEVTHKITLLYTVAIAHQDQIRFGSRTFEIVGEPINEEERNIQIVLMCVERK